MIGGYFAYSEDNEAACGKIIERFKRNLVITLIAGMDISQMFKIWSGFSVFILALKLPQMKMGRYWMEHNRHLL